MLFPLNETDNRKLLRKSKKIGLKIFKFISSKNFKRID